MLAWVLWKGKQMPRRTPVPGRRVRGSSSGRPIMALLDLLGQRWMLRALEATIVEGIKTTIPLHARLIAEPDFLNGDYDIHWLESFLGHRG